MGFSRIYLEIGAVIAATFSDFFGVSKHQKVRVCKDIYGVIFYRVYINEGVALNKFFARALFKLAGKIVRA